MKIDIKEIERTKSKTKDKVELNPVKPPKYLENEMERFNKYMIKQIKQRFENQVLAKMNQTTVQKFKDAEIDVDTFYDAQVGNYAVVFQKLVNDFVKKIKKQFSQKRINKLTKKLYQNASDYNKTRFVNTVDNKIGIDLEQVFATGLNTFVNAKTIQSTDMIEKLRDETIAAYKTNTLRRMSAGSSLEDLYKQVREQTKVQTKKADLIARNELKMFNAELSKKRSQNVGIKKAIWRTAQDERVRGNPGGLYPNAKCKHYNWDGQEYEIGKGILCTNDGKYYEPGEAINCRCVAIPVVEFDE